MGTAVFHPQDYLAVQQSGRNYQLSRLAESPSPVARPNGRTFPAVYEASIPGTECGRDVASCNKTPSRGRSLSNRKIPSAGLLPLPDQSLQGSHYTYRRLAPGVSACGSREIADSSGIKHSVPCHHSSSASEVYISRRPNVPMVHHAACSQRLLSGHFPLHGVRPHQRRPLQRDARFPFNPAQGMSSCAGRTAISFQKPKYLTNLHFHDVLNPVRLKRAESFDQNVRYGKTMHPDFKVLTYGRQGKSMCSDTSIIDRKFNVNKQFKRSASEKVQESLVEMPDLRRPASKEGGKKLVTSLSEGVVGSHSGKSASSEIEVKLTSSAPPTLSQGRKLAQGRQMHASLDVATRGRVCVVNAGTIRSSQVTIPQQMACTIRNVGASLHGQCSGSMDVALEHRGLNVMEHKDVDEKDQMEGIPGFAPQDEDDRCKVDVTSTFNKQSAGSTIRRPETIIGSDGMPKGHSSVLENGEMWVSMMNDERWAGPSFFNSPSPSSLPFPSFTFLFSRTPSTGSKPTNTADCGPHMVSEKSSLQANCTWDAAFVTKDLRRMLRLDHASFDF